MDKMINVAMYMCIFSLVTLSSNTTDMVIGAIIAAAITFMGYSFTMLFKKINATHDFMKEHTANHAALERDLRDAENDVKGLRSEIQSLRDQITVLSTKMDVMLRELKLQQGT